MVGLVIAFPSLVSSGLTKEPTVDVDKAFREMQQGGKDDKSNAPAVFDPPPAASGAAAPAGRGAASGSSDSDAMNSLIESMQRDKEKDKKP